MKPVLPALLLLCSTAHAVPGQFTHQGRLLDGDGVPLEGDTTITFRVTDSDSGGDELWEETLTVPVTNGFYSAVLGADEEGNPLDVEVLSQAPAWLELQLEGAPAMYPRTPIHSVPYATMATVAEEVSGGPVDASEVAVDGSLVINDAGEWVGPALTVNWSDLEGVPADFADGVDDDTTLGESEVDSMVADNGYAMSSEVFSGSFLDLSDVPEGLEDGDTTLSEPEVDEMVSDNGYALATDVASEVAALLAEIDTLKEQVAALEETGGSDLGTVMYGNYSINNTVDLAALEGFTEVTGNLSIQAGSIPNLDALSSLTSVGKELEIRDNESLINLDGLSSLTSVGKDLDIANNASLENVDGLSSLTSVGESLLLEYNNALTNIDGLSGLSSVGFEVAVKHHAVLENVDGLIGLTDVAWDLEVRNNPSLSNVDGLINLTTVGNSLWVVDNDAITDVDGLSGLSVVIERLDLSENEVLADITGLHGLTTSSYLTINSNPDLCRSVIDAFLAVIPSTVFVASTAGNDESC